MYAIIEQGGKQYRVVKGDKFRVEKLQAEDGSVVELGKVILLGKDDETVIGTPYVEGAKVTAKILESGKDDKVIVFKYRRKKNYRKFRGHRQQYTTVTVEEVKDKPYSNTIFKGFSYCSYKDRYSKKTGRELAYYNAISEMLKQGVINSEESVELDHFKLNTWTQDNRKEK